MSDEAARAAELLPAECLARYEPRRVLASGGFGVVILARQRALDRDVVLKVLHEVALADQEQVERFREEARITAALNHPSIVTVYDHGVEGRVPWIACEYIAGSTLRALCDAGPLPVARAVEIARDVAGALAAAHEHGILHRDVKPENVLIGARGAVKLADFGIAKWSGQARVETQAGMLMGTPAYFAPEVVAGEAASVQSELYALGVLLFEVLAGRPPFSSDHLAGILHAHVHVQPARVATLREGVPPRLDALVASLLAKDPLERPKSARALAAALTSVLADRKAFPAGRAASATPSAPRAFVLLAVLTALGVAALALIVRRPAAIPVTQAAPTASAEKPLFEQARQIERDEMELRGQRRSEVMEKLGSYMRLPDMEGAARLSQPLIGEEENAVEQSDALARRLEVLEPDPTRRSNEWLIAQVRLARAGLSGAREGPILHRIRDLADQIKAGHPPGNLGSLEVGALAFDAPVSPEVIRRVDVLRAVIQAVLERAAGAPERWHAPLDAALPAGVHWASRLVLFMKTRPEAARGFELETESFGSFPEPPGPLGKPLAGLARAIWKRARATSRASLDAAEREARAQLREIRGTPTSPELVWWGDRLGKWLDATAQKMPQRVISAP